MRDKMKQIRILRVMCSLLLLTWLCTLAQELTDTQERALYRKKGFILLEGEQQGDYEQGRYLVIRDVTVPRDQKLTFLPGASVFFKRATRIVVDGTLECRGSSDGMVSFAKLEGSHYAAPIDSQESTEWTELLVNEGGGLEMHQAWIQDSKMGINAVSKYSTIILDNVYFEKNRYRNLYFAGAVISVVSGIPTTFNSYSYLKEQENSTHEQQSASFGPVQTPPAATSQTPTQTSSAFSESKQDLAKQESLLPTAVGTPGSRGSSISPVPWFIPVRFGCGLVTLGTAGLAGYFYYAYWNYGEKYHQVSKDDPEMSTKLKDFKDKSNRARLYCIYSSIPCITALIGFSLTYTLSSSK